MLIVLAASLIASSPAHHPHRLRHLSDADLVRYAASPFDARKMMLTQEKVGLHRGTLVVADYYCGDVCPTYTRRIIHYAVPVAECARVGGVVQSEVVVRGVGLGSVEVCKPRVLARKQSTR